MKQYTVTTKTYTYDELPQAVRSYADDRLRHFYNSDPLSQFILEDVIEDQKTRLEDMGIEVSNIWWSLGYSQGDYAVIEGSIDIKAYLKANKMVKDFRGLYTLFQWGWSIWAGIKTWGDGNFSVSVESDYWNEDHRKEQKIQNDLNDLEKAIIDHLKTLNREIYKALEKDDMYYMDSKHILEAFEDNDTRFRFTEDGEIYTLDED